MVVMEGVFDSVLGLEQSVFCVYSGSQQGRKHEARVTGLGLESCRCSFLLWALSKSHLYIGLRGFQKVLPDLRAPRQVAHSQPVIHPFHRCWLSGS